MLNMLDRNVANYTRMLDSRSIDQSSSNFCRVTELGCGPPCPNTYSPSVEHAMRVVCVRLLGLTSRGVVRRGMRSLLGRQAEGADLREPISIATKDLPSWAGRQEKARDAEPRGDECVVM